jgi:hypothetical protein
VGQGPGGTPPPGTTAQPPDDYLNEVVPIRNGKPGTPITFPGTELADQVACPASTSCETIGFSKPLSKSAFIPLRSGKPGKPVAVAGHDIWFGIACASAGNCVAVGQVTTGPSTSHGVIAVLRKGKALKPKRFSTTSEFDGVSCLNAKTCIAVGSTNLFKHGVFDVISSGHVGKLHVAKSTGGMNGIACGWAKGSCVVPAFTSNKFGVFPARAVIHGTKVTVKKLSNTAPGLTFTCPSVGHCVGFGVVKPNQKGQRAVVAIVTKGHVGPITKVAGAGSTGWVACVKVGSCDAYASSLTGVDPGDILRSFTVTY